MATYSHDIQGIMPEPVAREIIQAATRESTFMALGSEEPVVNNKIKVAIEGDQPTGQWIGEGEKIKGSKISIGSKTASGHKLGAIVVVSREAYDRSELDLWEYAKPRLVHTFARMVDQRYLFRYADSDTVSVVREAIDNGRVHIFGTEVDLAADVLKTKFSTERKATRLLLPDDLEMQLLNLRDNSGRPIYVSSVADGGEVVQVWNTPTTFYLPSDAETVEYDGEEYQVRAIAIETVNGKSPFRYGVDRQVRFEVFKEGIVELNDGTEINLLSQDMVALRCTFIVAGMVAAPAKVAVGLEPIS